MHQHSPEEYKHESDLHSEEALYDYLYRTHETMASRLFVSYSPLELFDRSVACEVYAGNKGFWFVTFFDEDGDTCHRIYDIHEAVRIGLHHYEEKQEQEQIVAERRAQMHLVEPEKS